MIKHNLKKKSFWLAVTFTSIDVLIDLAQPRAFSPEGLLGLNLLMGVMIAACLYFSFKKEPDQVLTESLDEVLEPNDAAIDHINNFKVDSNNSAFDIFNYFLDFKISQIEQMLNDPSISIKNTIKLHEEIVGGLKIAFKDDDWQSVCRFHYINYARNKKQHDLDVQNTKFNPLPDYLRSILLALEDFRHRTPPYTVSDLRPGFIPTELQKFVGKYQPKPPAEMVPNWSH